MKRLVRESIDFERGGDRRTTIGLNPSPTDRENFVDYIIKMIPGILGTETIPEDIIINRNYWINPPYSREIGRWLSKKFPTTDFYSYSGTKVEEGKKYPGYSLWGELRRALENMGYSVPKG